MTRSRTRCRLWRGLLTTSALCALACGNDDGPNASGGGTGAIAGALGNAGAMVGAGTGVAGTGASGTGVGGAGNGTSGVGVGGATAGTQPLTGGTSGTGASGTGAGGEDAGTPIVRPPPKGNGYDGARETTVSFDSGWRFHLGDLPGAQATAFDDSPWTELDLPHDWSIEQPFEQSSPAGSGGGYLDGGVGWYRKTFSLPASSAGQEVLVQLDGVYMDSTVWLNGEEVCARPYGYISFECDLTANANLDGDNVLAVRVNNELPSSRWYSGSGIYRHVWLKTTNPVAVAYMGTRVTTPQISAMRATVDVEVSVSNRGAAQASVTVANAIVDATGAEVATSTGTTSTVGVDETSEIMQTLTVDNPELWSPSSPSMYSVVTTLEMGGAVVDTYTTPLGIRSFAFDADTGFSINGQRLKLNGVCLHHDLGALGAAVNTRAMEKRLELLKQMGANAIRTSHNPPAPEFLDLTDRLGFLVMDEAFDQWYGAKNPHDYARFFNQWSERDIGDMVLRDRNHPSVVMWSIGNEIPQAADQNVANQLMDTIRAFDDTRAIGQAFAAWSYDEGTAALEDYVGLNYNPGMYDSQHAQHATWKLVGSETSSAIRSRGIYNNQNTQCSSYDDSVVGWGQSAEASWRDINTRDWIAGEFIWTGFDYIGEPTPYEWPAKSSYFGAIDTANFPKDIFYFYQSRWNYDGEPMVHIVPMNWTTWGLGQSVKVMVYSNAQSVELFLNDASLGSKTVDPAQGHLEWSVPFATGTLEARASEGGSVVATDQVRTAGAAAALELTVDRSTIAADARDLAFVEIDVVDAAGVVVPDASNTVELTVDGAGVLVGLDNGNAISHESYKGSSYPAFSGKLMAMVQATDQAGQISVEATSNGLTAGSVTIATQ